jgi:putative tryptophan/tyrosine transport system substrate-binding protein
MRLIGLAVILVLSLVLTPVVGAAQPTGKVWRIGVLTTGNPLSAPPANWEGFLHGLRESGYVEGQNVAFEQRYAEGKPELFPDRAADLVRLKVDAIFARGPWAVTAAKAATRTIPIIGLDLESDPIADGFVKSLARPGENITGMFLDLAELSGKQLQILKEIIPKLPRVAILGDPAVNASQLRELRVVARSLAVQTQALEMKSSKDLESAFEAANKGHARALIVLSNPLTLAARTQIGDMAVKRRLPTMYLYRAHVDAGGLISYGPDLLDMFRRCGEYVGRILGGAKPSELPVERPVRFDLVLNLKTAKALGLTIPQTLLLRADQVIE